MRVVTWNVLHGRSPTDRRVDLDRFADAVASLDADVLALQEVDRNLDRSLGADLAAVAAEAMEATAYRFAPALLGSPWDWRTPRGDVAPDAPGYGIALLSRPPVSSSRVLRLPRVRTPAPTRPEGGLLPSMIKEEPRVAVSAVVEAPTGPLVVTNTHLSFLPWWNGLQLRSLVRALQHESDPPRLLLGDLNMGPAKARRIGGMTSLVSARTFPAHRPVRQLDHVLADGGLRVVSAEARQLPLSDHRALVVDLG